MGHQEMMPKMSYEKECVEVKKAKGVMRTFQAEEREEMKAHSGVS